MIYDGLHHDRFEVWTRPADGDTSDLYCRDRVTGELWLARDGLFGREQLMVWQMFQIANTPVPNGAPSGLSSSTMKANSVDALLVSGDDDATTNSLNGLP